MGKTANAIVFEDNIVSRFWGLRRCLSRRVNEVPDRAFAGGNGFIFGFWQVSASMRRRNSTLQICARFYMVGKVVVDSTGTIGVEVREGHFLVI